MSNNVFANGLEIACKAADGKSMAAFPDPCFSPPPPNGGWVLVPYANTAFAKDLTNCSTTVFITGLPVAKKDESYISTSTGNEPAAGPMGKKTGVKKGKAYFTSWSMNVKVEGLSVCRHTDGMTHNHGSSPGNTKEWRYLDTSNSGECTDEIKKVKKNCGENEDDKGKRKKKSPSSKKDDKPSSWKEDHCKGLMKKPKGIKLDELAGMVTELQKKLEALDVVDTITEKVIDVVENKALTTAAKIAAKKPIQAVLGPLGWAWAAYDVVDGAMEMKDLMNYLDEVKAEAARVKESIQGLDKKLTEVQDAVKNGDVDKASEMMADMQQNTALMDACTRARKCMLVPFGDTSKKTQGNMSNKKGCCPGQTGHHMIPDGYMKGKSICDKYTTGSAPTVCVEGTNQYHGSHGKIHTETELAIKDEVSGGEVEYEDARDAATEAHKNTFPLSMCSKGCMKAQMDNYYHERCDNQSGLISDPNPDLKYCEICPVPEVTEQV